MSSTQQLRERVRSRVWQALARAGLGAPTLPAEQLEQFVNEVADGVLLEIDAALEEGAAAEEQNVGAAGDAPLNEEEQTLWQGRPFLSLNERYVVTTERIRVIRGLLSRDREDLELVRIQDIEHTQSLGERLLKLGDITITSADPSHPQMTLRNVRDPEEVHEIVRRAMLQARKRAGMLFREEI